MTGATDMDEDTGRIGRYVVRRVLGSGAFATVWLGRDDDLDVAVAIKVLADNWTHNEEVRARFVDEARILRRISDGRVVGVHDIGSLPDGRSYFVMDYADGGTLADRLGGPDRASALSTAVEVGRAVQILHEHGVLHRDVKPSNLLLRTRLGRGEQLMIADLGTAKALAEASGLTLSAGTPAYMAPEQAHGRWGLDERADVYGIAAVSYALLTGAPPFSGEREISDVAFRDPGRRPGPVDDRPGPLDDLLSSALAFDPDERPGSADEFADRMLRIAVDEAAGRGDDPVTLRIPAVRPRSGSQRTRITPPTRTASLSAPADEGSRDAQTANPRPDPSEQVEESLPSAEPRRPQTAPAGRLTPAGLVALALLIFVVTAVGVWLLL